TMPRTFAWVVIIDTSTKKLNERGVPGATVVSLPSLVGYVVPPSFESQRTTESAVEPPTFTVTESGLPGGMCWPFEGCAIWSDIPDESAAATSSFPEPKATFGTTPVKASVRAVDWSRARIAVEPAFIHVGRARRSATAPVTWGA